VCLKRVGGPGWRDRNSALVAGFRVHWFLSKCCRMQDRSQDNRDDDSHGFILPPNVPDIPDSLRKIMSIFPRNELRNLTFGKINEHGFLLNLG
jgi:hypothetical protein